VAIWADDMQAQAIPVSTPWAVRCDRYGGLSIAFITNLTELSGGRSRQRRSALIWRCQPRRFWTPSYLDDS
jgi:hypothetical protein